MLDNAGAVLCERKVATEPADIALLLTSVGGDYVRIGPLVAMAGERFGRDGLADGVCRDPAHEGTAEGPAGQQDGSQ